LYATDSGNNREDFEEKDETSDASKGSHDDLKKYLSFLVSRDAIIERPKFVSLTMDENKRPT
jgi:hypothetical protein